MLRRPTVSWRLNGTADGVLAADFPRGDLQTEVGVDVNHELDLAVGLDALDGEFGDGLLGLPDDLADLILLVLIGVEVGVVLVIIGLGLLLLGLGLGLGDLDFADTLDDANEHVTAVLGNVVLGNAAGGEGGLGVEEGQELNGITRGELNTNGVVEVGSRGNHRVHGLLDVFRLELLDERGLDSSTPGGQLRGVDGSGLESGGEDLGLFREDAASEMSNLGGVRNTTREDDLLNMVRKQLVCTREESRTSSMSKTSNPAFWITCSIKPVN